MWPLFANFAGLRLRPSSAGSGSAPPPQAVAPPFLRLLCSPQAVASPFLRLLCSQQAVAPPLQSKKPKSKK